MNKENMRKAITVMERVAAGTNHQFDMGAYQKGEVSYSEAHAVKCGTACCFAGWLSISPEFNGILKSEVLGIPVSLITGAVGPKAIAEVLGLELNIGNMLCGLGYDSVMDSFTSVDFYGVSSFPEITPEIVVNKLRSMLERAILEEEEL